MQSRAVVLGVVLAAFPVISAADANPLPVLLESPPCAHEKLGSVTAEVGQRVNESTQDGRVPTIRVQPAFERLAHAAAEKGANAVVLRSHQGVYFTYGGRRSSAPVYLKLAGGAVRLPDDTSTCRLVLADARELDRQLRARNPDQVTSKNAYSGD